MEDLKILQKTFDMIEFAYPVLDQFPKSEKFALVADIKRCMDELLELLIEAQKKYYKKNNSAKSWGLSFWAIKFGRLT